MFAVVNLLGGSFGDFSSVAKEDIGEEIKVDRQKLATYEMARANAVKAGQKTTRWDEKITDVRAEITAMEAVRSGNLSKSAVQVSDDSPAWLRAGPARRQDPDLVAYKLQDNASKYSWLIIPLSVPFVWLLFPFSRRFKSLRPHRFRHLFAVLHEPASDCGRSVPVGRSDCDRGAAVADPAVSHLPPAQRSLRPGCGGALWRTVLLTLFALIVISLFWVLVVGASGTFD